MTLLEICKTLLENKDVIADSVRSGEEEIKVGEYDIPVRFKFGLCMVADDLRGELKDIFSCMGLDYNYPVENDEWTGFTQHLMKRCGITKTTSMHRIVGN